MKSNRNHEMERFHGGGICIYCGKPTGLANNQHSACAEMHDWGRSQIISLATSVAQGNSQEVSIENLYNSMKKIANNFFVSEAEIRESLIIAWGQAVDHFMSDGYLSRQEEAYLHYFANYFGINQEELKLHKSYEKFIKGIVLREVMEGRIPRYSGPLGGLPVNLQRDESLVWIFRGVEYYEKVTRRRRVGSSSSVSIRVARGVYLRTSSFDSESVEYTETVYVDKGTLLFTTKHIYFSGKSKAFRVRLNKIASFTPYEDGFGIHRDAQSAKPQIFVTGDGQFAYKLALSIARFAG